MTHPSGQVSATVVAHSISQEGKEMITFEIEYPRIILAELNTHRQLSKNSSSSRAIPVKKVNQMISEAPAMPVRFGQHQAGMQDQGVDYNEEIQIYGDYLSPQEVWNMAAEDAVFWSRVFLEYGYAKQVCNRLTEPFQRMKTVISGTEWENFFWLRCDADADPTIEALATTIRQAKEQSLPELLLPGEWHTPYVSHFYEDVEEGCDDAFTCGYFVKDENGEVVVLTKEEAIAISASCCAQVSYRVLNNSKEKALDIYGKLLTGNKIHASPFEHQATPMEFPTGKSWLDSLMTGKITQDSVKWEEGTTHLNQEDKFGSGNLVGWIQHRQLLQNHSK